MRIFRKRKGESHKKQATNRILNSQLPVCDMFPFRVRMSIAITMVQILFMQPFLWETVSQQTSWYSGLTLFPFPLPWCSLSYRCRNCGTDVSTVARLPMIHWSPHCVQLWFSMMVSICCEDKLLWQRVRVTLLCGIRRRYKMYLEIRLL